MYLIVGLQSSYTLIKTPQVSSGILKNLAVVMTMVKKVDLTVAIYF